MKSFVCQQNIDHYRKLLEVTTGEIQRREIKRLLAAAEVELQHLSLKAKRNRESRKK